MRLNGCPYHGDPCPNIVRNWLDWMADPFGFDEADDNDDLDEDDIVCLYTMSFVD